MSIGSPDRIRGYEARPRVLVVEDDGETRTLLCEVLRAHGYEPRGVADSAQALLRLRENDAHAIVLDKGLPGLNGLEILPGIRLLYPEVPVVFITAFGDPRTEAEARERGATAFLSKPFRMADLLEVLDTHFCKALAAS